MEEDRLEANFDDFKSTEERNIRAISKTYETEIDIFKRFFNVQNKLYINHVGGILDPYYGLKITKEYYFKHLQKLTIFCILH